MKEGSLRADEYANALHFNTQLLVCTLNKCGAVGNRRRTLTSDQPARLGSAPHAAFPVPATQASLIPLQPASGQFVSRC